MRAPVLKDEAPTAAPVLPAEEAAVKDTVKDLFKPPAAEVAEGAKEYHVVAGQNLLHAKHHYREGDSIMLTAEQATSFGGLVRIGIAPKPDTVAKRSAGKYVICEERSYYAGGKMRMTGDVVELSAEEARSLGDTVTPA